MAESLVVLFVVLFFVFGFFLGIAIFERTKKGKPSSDDCLSPGWHEIKAVVRLESDYVWVVLLGDDDSEPRYFKIDRNKILDTPHVDILSAKKVLKVNEWGKKYIQFIQ